MRNEVAIGKSSWATYIVVWSALVHPMNLCTDTAMVARERVSNARMHFQARSACTDKIRSRETLILNTPNVPRLMITIGAQVQVQVLRGNIIQLTQILPQTKP